MDSPNRRNRAELQLARARQKTEHTYWKARLAQAGPKSSLPADRPATSLPARYGTWQHRLPAGLSAKLNHVSNGSPQRLQVLLMAALGWFTARMTGRDEVLFGTATLHREAPAGQLNTLLPIR